jgi:hypothetical protein
VKGVGCERVCKGESRDWRVYEIVHCARAHTISMSTRARVRVCACLVCASSCTLQHSRA